MTRAERSLFAGLMAVGVALIVVLGLLVIVWAREGDATGRVRSNVIQVQALQTTLKANVQNQVRNRTANVATWCGAINAGRDYDRAFIRSVTHGRLTYTLGDLDCVQLERKTLASTKPH